MLVEKEKNSSEIDARSNRVTRPLPILLTHPEQDQRRSRGTLVGHEPSWSKTVSMATKATYSEHFCTQTALRGDGERQSFDPFCRFRLATCMGSVHLSIHVTDTSSLDSSLASTISSLPSSKAFTLHISYRDPESQFLPNRARSIASRQNRQVGRPAFDSGWSAGLRAHHIPRLSHIVANES
jgi:hypothetical protein